MEAWIQPLLAALNLPQIGLGALFLVATLSATLLPLGSEPVLFGLVTLQPQLFWPAVLVATLGNTLGGAISWGMGYAAHQAVDKARGTSTHLKALAWLERFGPKACLLSWLPVVGDPLCSIAGWLKLPLWPCVAYMAIGKFLRYVTMTSALMWAFPGTH